MQSIEQETGTADLGNSPEKTGIGRIVMLGHEGIAPYVPPLSDYLKVSDSWKEAEYRCYQVGSEKVTVGYWTGEPGCIALDPWPYTEVCSILSGRVAIRDLQGAELVFGAGQGFVVPKGWAGVWVTLEPSSKLFVMIE